MRIGGRLAEHIRSVGPIGRRIVAVSLCASLVVGCSDDGGDDDGADAGPDTTAAGAVEPAGDPEAGGEIRLGIEGPIVVDPARANPGSPSDLMVLDLLHDGLVRATPDGEVEPAVASSWRDDGKKTAFAFVIDPEATFASGAAITPQDVIASLERVAKGGDGSLAALRLESVVGFRAFVDGKEPHLRGLTAPNEEEVLITLSEPVAVLPQVLAGPEFGIVDVESLDGAEESEDLSELDLSGSWAVSSSSDDELALSRRDGAPGHLDGVSLRSYESGVDAYDAFDDGDVDWALVPGDRYGDAVDDHGDEHFAPFHAELFFGLRVAGPPLNHRELRQAIAAAVDTEAIVETVYASLADPLAGIVPAGVAGHEDDPCERCGFDPARAKALIAASFPDGNVPTVEVDFDQSTSQEAMAEMILDDLEEVGIPATLRPKSLEEYKRFVVTGGQRMFSFGWIGGYASPDAYLSSLFVSDSDDNLTGLANADIDASLNAARAGADNAAARWRSIEGIVLDAAVVIPVAQFRTQAVAGEKVQGLAHAVDGSVDWSQVWLDS